MTMALETATYISDLVTTNPTSTDPKSQGDDHIRLVKSTLKTTFPNITGVVSVTHGDLNTVPDLAPKASPTFTGTVTVPTPVNSTDAVTKGYVDSAAMSTALPGQTGNAGKFVTTDGTTASWATVLPAQTGNTGKFLVTDGTTASWATVDTSLFTNTTSLAQAQAIALCF